MIREAIKSELKKREWSVSKLALMSSIRYPSLTKFLNQKGSLSIDNLDIVFQTLDLSIQGGGQNKNGDNADQSATGSEPA